MPRRFWLDRLLFSVLLLCIPPEVLAEPADSELVGWFDLNTFKPASTPLDGPLLDNAAVLRLMQFSLGAALQIDDDPLTRQQKIGETYEQTAVVLQRLIALHLSGAIGLFNVGQLAVQIPVYLDEGTPGSSGDAGDLRVIPKLAHRFNLDGPQLGLAFVIPVGFPTGATEKFVGQGGFSIAPGLAVDLVVGRLCFLLNGAYLWRRKQTEMQLVRGAELIAGVGAQLTLLEAPGALMLFADVKGSTQTADLFGRAASPVDLLGGISYRFGSGVVVSLGAGAGLSPGVGAPDFRFIAGLGLVSAAFFDRPDEIPVAEVQDTDRDGIADDRDACPDKPEDFDRFEDQDGCPEPDNDGDGIDDIRDKCPNSPETSKELDKADGCPDGDKDEDQIPDGQDQCPDEPEDFDEHADGDGCPDPDNDLDAVMDEADECPELPESPNGIEDHDGCPEYFTVEGDRIQLKGQLRFRRNRADLVGNSRGILEELGTAIMANPGWKEVHIIVHTSGARDGDAEQLLSEDRAMAVLRFWIAMGLDPERLIAEGRGSSEPLASPDTRAGRRQNERVEFKIVKEP